MKIIQQFAVAALTLALAATVAAGSWWLITSKPAPIVHDKPTPPANIGKVVKEEDLNTFTLTEDAEKRIRLTTTPIVKKNVQRVRVYGGEVAIPVGRTILVSAPLTGVLKAPATGEVKAGQPVEARQVVFQLTPLLSPDGRATLSAALAEAEGQVNNAKAQAELTRIALDRGRRVLKEGAGSQRQVDEAQAANNVAVKTLEAATARLSILKKVVGDAELGTAAPIAIEAPENGIVRTVSALPGQTVPSGAPLFEVIDISTIWVRVPLPVGDLESIDRAAPAQIGKLSEPAGARLPLANPVAAPPSANPLAATVDVYYEMPNPGRQLLPGQRLGATIPLAGASENLTVPWSALVFDIHGGTWIYELVGPHRFARRRVHVGYTVGQDAVLSSGPPAGTQVVVVGAQQLFGAETGFVK